MADLDVMFSGFGVVDATVGGVTSKVLFDCPDEVIDDMVISAAYKATFITGRFPAIARGVPMTIGGHAYTVRNVRAIDDGALSVAELSK